MRKTIFFIGAVLAAVILSGCGHNINVQGWGFACPYGAMGYGTFSCTKDNVKVVSTEKTTKDGVESRNEFVVGEQVTGSDVELKKVDSGK
jgi:hypothetical protein